MTHNTETGVLNCLISVGMTPVLQDPKSRQDWGHLDREDEKLQTLWIGAIFTGKMTFWRDMCLTKVVHILEPGILNTLNSCQDDTLSLKNPSMGHLYRKNRANTYKIQNPKYIPQELEIKVNMNLFILPTRERCFSLYSCFSHNLKMKVRHHQTKV